MSAERDCINKALWLFRPTSPQGKAVLDLAALAERLLAGRGDSAPSDDEAALRRQIDDPALPVLLWADVLEERGEDQAVCLKLRWLAREGKWPGRTGGLYRWSAERPEFGGGASWTLPADAVAVLMTKSVHLGGKEKGRFPSPSAALLAAARVLAAREPAFEPEYQEEAVERVMRDCPDCGTSASRFAQRYDKDEGEVHFACPECGCLLYASGGVVGGS